MLSLSRGNSANLFRFSGSKELIVVFCLRCVFAVFNGFVTPREYSAAKFGSRYSGMLGFGYRIELGDADHLR